jgi:hypothetical protein
MQSEIVYSTQKRDFLPGVRYANPTYFTGPRAEATSIIVVGKWDNVVEAYLTAMPAIHVVRVETPEALSAYLEQRTRALVAKPGDWAMEAQSASETDVQPAPAPVMTSITSAGPEPSARDWERLPWFSLRKRVEQETGIRPKNKAEAIEIMRTRG